MSRKSAGGGSAASCVQAKSMFASIRNTTQLFAIILAGLLLGLGIYYFNILFVLGALIAALFAGRVFCGWICPNGAWLDHIVSRISPGRKMPRFLTHPGFGYGFTLVFLAAFFLLHWSISDTAWVWLVPMGIMGVQFSLATLFGAVYYHRGFCANVCPWGVLGSLLGRGAPYQMRIDPQCKSCKTCVKACPLGGIPEPAVEEVKNSGGPARLSSKCMRCMRCVAVCPTNALQMGSKKEEKEVAALYEQEPQYREAAN